MSKKIRLSKLTTQWEAHFAAKNLAQQPNINHDLPTITAQNLLNLCTKHAAPAADSVIHLKARYSLNINDCEAPSSDSSCHSKTNLLPLIPQTEATFQHTGEYQCSLCFKPTKKLFDSFCYRCLTSKAAADNCILNPNRCHFLANTCREPEWGLANCYQPHVLYLSFTDKFKVGITRASQIPTRWIDQGATLACALAMTNSRHQVGVLEHALTAIVSDRSHWSNMLKMGNKRPTCDEVKQCIDRIFSFVDQTIIANQTDYVVAYPEQLPIPDTPLQPIVWFREPQIVTINYPWPEELPPKLVSLQLSKTPAIGGKLLGVKGQYLLFPSGVVNIRRHEGYLVEVFP